MTIGQIPVMLYPVFFKVLSDQPLHRANFKLHLTEITLFGRAFPHQHALVRHFVAVWVFYHILLPLDSVQHQSAKFGFDFSRVCDFKNPCASKSTYAIRHKHKNVLGCVRLNSVQANGFKFFVFAYVSSSSLFNSAQVKKMCKKLNLPFVFLLLFGPTFDNNDTTVRIKDDAAGHEELFGVGLNFKLF